MRRLVKETMSASKQIIFAFLVLIGAGGGPHPRISASHSGDTSVAESMQRLAREIFTAYERRDTAIIKSFYSRQPDALFFWERKMTYTWAQLDTTIDALVRAAAELKLSTSDFRSGGSGSTGWFAATFHIDRVTPEGQRSSSDGRWTVVAEKLNGKWLIVHEHTSFPLPKP